MRSNLLISSTESYPSLERPHTNCVLPPWYHSKDICSRFFFSGEVSGFRTSSPISARRAGCALTYSLAYTLRSAIVSLWSLPHSCPFSFVGPTPLLFRKRRLLFKMYVIKSWLILYISSRKMFSELTHKYLIPFRMTARAKSLTYWTSWIRKTRFFHFTSSKSIVRWRLFEIISPLKKFVNFPSQPLWVTISWEFAWGSVMCFYWYHGMS